MLQGNENEFKVWRTGFHDNYAGKYGGAVCLNHATSTTIEKVGFYGNAAELSGGAVCMEVCIVFLTKLKFCCQY